MIKLLSKQKLVADQFEFTDRRATISLIQKYLKFTAHKHLHLSCTWTNKKPNVPNVLYKYLIFDRHINRFWNRLGLDSSRKSWQAKKATFGWRSIFLTSISFFKSLISFLLCTNSPKNGGGATPWKFNFLYLNFRKFGAARKSGKVGVAYPPYKSAATQSQHQKYKTYWHYFYIRNKRYCSNVHQGINLITLSNLVKHKESKNRSELRT